MVASNSLISLVGGIEQMYSISSRAEKHKSIARGYEGIVRKIHNELDLYEGDYEKITREFIRDIQGEYEALTKESPDIPPCVLKKFLENFV